MLPVQGHLPPSQRYVLWFASLASSFLRRRVPFCDHARDTLRSQWLHREGYSLHAVGSEVLHCHDHQKQDLTCSKRGGM